jgi:hypothetical protein
MGHDEQRTKGLPVHVIQLFQLTTETQLFKEYERFRVLKLHRGNRINSALNSTNLKETVPYAKLSNYERMDVHVAQAME